jgi:hypothetical protein
VKGLGGSGERRIFIISTSLGSQGEVDVQMEIALRLDTAQVLNMYAFSDAYLVLGAC